jgi:arylsulfatase A-like enzyme
MDAPARPPRRSSFWPCAALAAALAAVKAVGLGPPREPAWGLDLAAVAHADVLFALGLFATAEAGLLLAAHRPRIARAIVGFVLVFGALAVCWAVANLTAVEYFSRPITVPLFRLVGAWRNIVSSIGARLTPAVLVELVVLPSGYVALALALARFAPRAGRRGVVGAALAAALFAGVGDWRLATEWRHRDQGIAESPHWALLASALAEAAGPRAPSLPASFPPEFARDFEAPGERPAAGFFAPPEGRARPRNVILIVLESTGAKYLGVYGSAYATTPNLAREAAQSLVFDRVSSHEGYTFCSMVALTYSVFPGLPWHYLAAPAGVPTLADVLAARGYRAAFVHSGDLQWEGEYTLLEGHGFGDVWDYRDLGCPRMSSWGAEDGCAIDGMVRWIDRDPARPFFLMCWTDQSHDPYELSPGEPVIDFFAGAPRPPHADELGRYLNVIHTVDRHLGRLFEALRARGLADDTLVVITGDHGEAFGAPHDARGHGAALYEECVRVPLILWNPRLFAPGGRSDAIGGHKDVNATILDVLGIEPPARWQGRSLFDPGRPPRAYAMAGSGGDECLLGVREERWKYVFSPVRGREKLFDLARDPDEQRNLAEEEPEVCDRLRERVAAFVAAEQAYMADLDRARAAATSRTAAAAGSAPSPP